MPARFGGVPDLLAFESPRRLMEHAAQAIERARTSHERGEPFDKYVKGDLLEARELIDVVLHDLEEYLDR